MTHAAPPKTPQRETLPPEIDKLLHQALSRSDDPDTATACVITDGATMTGSIIGSNRLSDHIPADERTTTRPAKYDFIVHAEQEAIGFAARHGIELDGSTMFLSWFPCASCARLLVLAGIATLVADLDAYESRRGDPRYGFQAAMQILVAGGVTIRWF